MSARGVDAPPNGLTAPARWAAVERGGAAADGTPYPPGPARP